MSDEPKRYERLNVRGIGAFSTCCRCGAMVHVAARARHDEWHQRNGVVGLT